MSSGYGNETAAILGYLESNWTDTPIAFPNTAFSPDGHAAYIEPKLRRGTAFNASVSTRNRRIRRPGLLVIEIRQRKNTGDDKLQDYGTTLADLFENLALDAGASTVHFRAATVRIMGPNEGWYVAQVECPYWRDAIQP